MNMYSYISEDEKELINMLNDYCDLNHFLLVPLIRPIRC